MKRCVIIGGGPIERYDIIRSYLSENDYCIFCDCGLKHMEPLGVRPDLIVGDFDSFDRDRIIKSNVSKLASRPESIGDGSENIIGAPDVTYDGSRNIISTSDMTECGSKRIGDESGRTGDEPERTGDGSGRTGDGSERIVTASGEIIGLCPVKDDTDTGHAVTVAVERGFTEFLLLGMTGRRMDHSLGNIYLLHRLDELGLKAMIVDDYSEMSMVNREPVYIDDRLPFFSLINITGKAAGIDIEGAKYPLHNAEILQTANDLGISNEVPMGKTARIIVREGKLLLVRDFVG